MGLVAMNAIGTLAASGVTKWEFVEEFWNASIPSGQDSFGIAMDCCTFSRC